MIQNLDGVHWLYNFYLYCIDLFINFVDDIEIYFKIIFIVVYNCKLCSQLNSLTPPPARWGHLGDLRKMRFMGLLGDTQGNLGLQGCLWGVLSMINFAVAVFSTKLTILTLNESDHTVHHLKVYFNYRIFTLFYRI